MRHTMPSPKEPSDVSDWHGVPDRLAVSSEVGEGFADGEAGGAGGCCFGGEYGAKDDDCGPDDDGGDGDPEGQRCVHEEVAEPGADDRGESKRWDDRHQAAGEGEEDAFGDDDAADSLRECSDGVHDTELSGPIEDVGAHRRGQADAADHAHGDGDRQHLQKLMLRSRANALVAVRRVAEVNAGRMTAGIDGKTALLPNSKADLADWAQRRTAGWDPWPVKRAWVPKAGGRQRPLGIPTGTAYCAVALVL